MSSFDEWTPLSAIIESAFFEENDLPIEAMMALESKESDDAALAEPLQNLLVRYGFGQAKQD